MDKEACVSACAYFGKDSSCYNNKITNTIVFGCEYAGFVVPGQDCDNHESQNSFRGNVAHSIDGCGANIFPDTNGNSHDLCYEGSHFAAYKNTQQSIATQFKTQEVRMWNIVSIDNQLGIHL